MNSGPQLALGARGRDVQRVQTIFVMTKMLGFDKIDGVFGTLTRNAVVAFQEGEDLPADGVVGDSTWQRMPADPGTPILKRGSTGSAVTSLQKGLLKVGGPGAPTDPGPPSLCKASCRPPTALPVEWRFSTGVSGSAGIRCQVLSPTIPSAGRPSPS